MYYLQTLQDGRWINTTYPGTRWSRVAKRRLCYYETTFTNQTYRVAFVMQPEHQLNATPQLCQ